VRCGRLGEDKATLSRYPAMGLGFCMLPSLLFRAQARLGLNPTQLAVLLQLADLWWEPNRKPLPKKADLAPTPGPATGL
jgi:hypothetical protein